MDARSGAGSWDEGVRTQHEKNRCGVAWNLEGEGRGDPGDRGRLELLELLEARNCWNRNSVLVEEVSKGFAPFVLFLCPGV